MVGHIEHHVEDTGRMEVMVGRSGKRTWSDAFKGRVVAETLVAGCDGQRGGAATRSTGQSFVDMAAVGEGRKAGCLGFGRG